jgi:hypothetical protein
MGQYVIVGHGSFNPESSSYLPEVLIPSDTTLQFFSDAGQKLVLPRGDYSQVGPMWNQLKDEGYPIQPKGVTYNFKLSPDTTDEHRESAKEADWGGASVVFIDAGQAYLCTGTTDTCPTPALNVEARENAVEDERWKHHCTGILGQLGGVGNELFWVACTSFTMAMPELPVLDTAAVSGPGASDDSKWVPNDAAYKEISEKNAQAIKDTANGGSVAIVAGGAVVLVGNAHGRRPADYVRRQTDIEEGLLTVKKGGAFSKGSIEVKGISAKQSIVRSEISEFSDKKITFL